MVSFNKSKRMRWSVFNFIYGTLVICVKDVFEENKTGIRETG